MDKRCQRVYSLDGDELTVNFVFSSEDNILLGDYPDFCETPRYTPKGKPWVNVTFEGCPYVSDGYCDCGSCEHLKTQSPGDLIGVCENEQMRLEPRKEVAT